MVACNNLSFCDWVALLNETEVVPIPDLNEKLVTKNDEKAVK
jgi:hypothetical protein